MYKVYKSRNQSIIVDEQNRLYQLITTKKANEIGKSVKCSVTIKEVLYGTLDKLNTSGYEKGQIVKE